MTATLDQLLLTEEMEDDDVPDPKNWDDDMVEYVD
jgi:hypothetical protein